VRTRWTAAFLMVFVVAVGVAKAADVFAALPAAEHDAAIPTLKGIVGFDWGEGITDPEQVLAYAEALANAAPDRARLVQYATSLEGRPLVLLVVSSSPNIMKLDEIRAQLARLGDSRVTPTDAAGALVSSLPAVVWLACSVHGDETSGGDAGLALAYHLLASRSDDVEKMLEKAVVIIDPTQNPDGRARFVASTRQARGVEPDPDPASAEHVQPWPGGRFSHDLFDLNRDWFALTSPETAGRVTAMLAWNPQVVADLHEMGPESGYYFAPPAKPLNPFLSKEQRALWEVLGHANAAAFDAHGWRYWTREEFDAFYPGYGESWPYFSGAVGMTYEEASARGLVTRLEDGTLLTYADAVQRHLVAAYTTVHTAAEARARLLREWYDYRRTAVEEGKNKAIVLGPGDHPLQTAALADLLARQGVEVLRSGEQGQGEKAEFVVPLAQPLGRLARVLLDREVSMGEAFEQSQERRDARREEDQIYDITAWSLPLLWDVPMEEVSSWHPSQRLERVQAGPPAPGQVRGAGRVAFLARWTGPAAAGALAALLQDGVKVRVAGKPFTIVGQSFPIGSLVIRRGDNPADLRARLLPVAARSGVDFLGVDTGFADDGIDLGSDNVRLISPPHVGLLWDAPTSPTSAGGLRFALERFLRYPVTALRVASLGRVDLSHYDVLIIPDSWDPGRYAAMLGDRGAKELGSWVRGGGVLVAVGNGAAWLTEEKVGLLDSKLEKREEVAKGEKPGEDGPAAGDRGSDRLQKEVTPTDEMPPRVPGAILRIVLDPESVYAAGFPAGRLNALAASDRVFVPLKLDRGVNVGVYAPAGDLVQSGFVLQASRTLLPDTAYLMVEKQGRGKVVAFAEDPAMRGMTRATMLLFANAVFFAPAF
jgi:hypothetical protein